MALTQLISRPMKRTTTKLQLKKHTVRILQGNELADVVGAAPTATCSQQATGCFQATDGCPPTQEGC